MDHSRSYCIPDPSLDLSTEEVIYRTPEFKDFLAYAEFRESVDLVPGRKSHFPMLYRDGYDDAVFNQTVVEPVLSVPVDPGHPYMMLHIQFPLRASPPPIIVEAT